MIISRTPFRISFFGGGTDIPDYYKKDYGEVVSITIDKYMYITVNKRFDDTIRVSYSQTEIVNHVNDIKHGIVREALKLTNITHGIEITSIADIPAKTGMGSSSVFTVGLLNALYAYKGVFKSAQELAEEACYIEMGLLEEPIGKQDQYAAAFGGMNHIQFNADESVFVNPIICSKDVKKEFKANLMLFYTGQERQASSVLSEQKQNTYKKFDVLTEMREMVKLFRGKMVDGTNISSIGTLLNDAWKCKKQMASNISNSSINEYYDIAIQNGALGGKILGAGGGGFLLLYVERQNQKRVSEVLNSLKKVEFDYEPQGSKIIFVG